MPQYPWTCDKCGLEVEVIRTFKEYEQPPEQKELPKDAPQCEHKWTRQIATGTRSTWVNPPPNTGGRY
jgi:predicted nucleic acid-binding Zn ribbon protein